MKGKKFYIVLIGLFVIGISSVFIYKQQQEARALEFEGYEIATIEDRVNGLFNDQKTDIKDEIESEILNLEQIFAELNEKDLSNHSEKQISEIEEEFQTAKSMFELEKSILNLFNDDDIIRNSTTLKKVDEVDTALTDFEDKTIYYSRNQVYIGEARMQVETIEEATELVAKLMIDEELNQEVTEEELDKLEELVKRIKDETVKNRLFERIETARLVLQQKKLEEVVLEEIDDEEEFEEEETEEIMEVEDLTEETAEEEIVDTKRESQQTTQQKPSPAPSANGSLNTGQSQSNSDSNQSSQPNKQPSSPSTNQSKVTENRPAVAKTYQETEVLEEIPFETHINYNNLVTAGKEIIYEEGAPGKIIKVIEVTEYTNGNISKNRAPDIRIEPVNRLMTIGTKEE